MSTRTPEQIERMTRRLGLATAASKQLRSAEWRAAHPEREQAILALLPDDTMATVQALLADVPSDSVTYMVWRIEGELRVMALTDVTADLPASSGGGA